MIREYNHRVRHLVLFSEMHRFADNNNPKSVLGKPKGLKCELRLAYGPAISDGI